MRGRGAKRVMYGSNYPMLQHQAIYKQLGTLKLDEEQTELFLRDLDVNILVIRCSVFFFFNATILFYYLLLLIFIYLFKSCLFGLYVYGSKKYQMIFRVRLRRKCTANL